MGNVRRDLHAACDRAGVPRVSPNDLRRTFASWLVQSGVDLFTVSKLMGHGSTRMVEKVYGMPVPQVRGCPCGFAFYTAFTGAMACPSCARELSAWEGAWPHTCSSGHAAPSGGECAQCVRVVAKESAVPAPVREWRDRT